MGYGGTCDKTLILLSSTAPVFFTSSLVGIQNYFISLRHQNCKLTNDPKGRHPYKMKRYVLQRHKTVQQYIKVWTMPFVTRAVQLFHPDWRGNMHRYSILSGLMHSFSTIHASNNGVSNSVYLSYAINIRTSNHSTSALQHLFFFCFWCVGLWMEEGWNDEYTYSATLYPVTHFYILITVCKFYSFHLRIL